MRVLLFALLSLLTSTLSSAQTGSVNKIYLFAAQYDTLTFSNVNRKPIQGVVKIGRYTLVETNLSELLINYSSTSRLRIEFSQEQVYYKQVGGFSLYGKVSPLSEEAFKKKVNEKGPGIYRHYFLDKELGLKLLDQKW